MRVMSRFLLHKLMLCGAMLHNMWIHIFSLSILLSLEAMNPTSSSVSPRLNKQRGTASDVSHTSDESTEAILHYIPWSQASLHHTTPHSAIKIFSRNVSKSWSIVCFFFPVITGFFFHNTVGWEYFLHRTLAFIEPMHRNKPNITYLLTYSTEHFVLIRLISIGALL